MEIYLVIRAHGLKQHLVQKREYLKLIEGEAELGELRYQDVIFGEELDQLLEAVRLKFIKRVELLIKVPSPYSSFFRAFLDRLELDNIKAKMREILGSTPVRLPLYPYFHHIKLEKLKSVDNLDDLIKLIRSTPYYLNLKKYLFVKVKEVTDLWIIEACLDSGYYQYLKREAKKTNYATRKIIDIEALITLAYWILILGEEYIRTLHMNNILQGLEPQARFRLRYIPSLNEILTTIGINPLEVKDIIKYREISQLMSILRREYMKRIRRIVLRNKHSLAYVYYYLILCENEMRNLERVILGHELGLSKEVITGSLLNFA